MSLSFEIPVELKQLITSNQAFHHRIVPISNNNGSVVFKTDQENLDKLKKELEIILNRSVVLEPESSQDIQSYLSYNYRKKTTGSNFSSDDSFLQDLLQTAKDFNSSDIHLEAYEDKWRVRFRLNGKLKEQYQLSQGDYTLLVNQIKVRAELDIAQKRISQDGRINVKTDTDEFDIRVSTMPTIHQEKVVLRILRKDNEAAELSELGFNSKELQMYLEGVKMPNGIVLISGPTGSGKTTTLYGTLKLLNEEETNIITIEDPVEYTLKGINQMQLHEDIGLDFPKVMRTFLRQDPDIIMVGEIRDGETASMAVKAALTGHLVLSTIHTNSAWGTISRLIDMGVEPHLLATTIKLSVAQRLVRQLCSDCKEEMHFSKGDFPSSFKEFSQIKTRFIHKGCDMCHYTGYQGRKAIYEIIPITSKLELAIKDNELQIDNYIKENNLSTLKTNAIALINSGETSIDEVYSLLAN